MPIIEKNVTVLNKAGFSSRLAASFVDRTSRFKSKVTVVKGDEQVNGRSIMGLVVLGAKDQVPLRLIVEGEDAVEAAAQLERFFIEESGKEYPAMFKNGLAGILALMIVSIFLYDTMVEDALPVAILVSLLMLVTAFLRKQWLRKILLGILGFLLLSGFLMVFLKAGAFSYSSNQKTFFALILNYIFPILFFAHPEVKKNFN